MREVSNKTLAMLVVSAVLVVVLATSYQLNFLSDIGSGTGLTGFAVENDTGTVQLTIANSLNIEVPAANSTIDFGTCTPDQSSRIADSNDTTASPVCDGDTGQQQFIRVNNIGNVNANINVSAECALADFLPQAGGSSNSTQFVVKASGAGCPVGNRTLTTYTDLGTSSLSVCTNLTTGSSNSIKMWARVNITSDSISPTAGCEVNDITFTAEQA